MRLKQQYGLALLILSAVLLTAHDCFALTGVTSKVTAVAQARSNSEANAVVFQNTVSGCTDNKAYIEYEDKEQFAAVLTAASQSLNVAALIDTAASSRVIGGHTTSMTCKVISLWIAGY